FVAPEGITADEGLSVERLYLIQQYLRSAAEREQQERPATETSDQRPDDREGGTGTRSPGEEGEMGNSVSPAKNRRYGVAGPKDNPEPHVAREAVLAEARTWGIIGILTGGTQGDPLAPTAP